VSGDRTLGVVLVYPELLGTYGDRGNATALVHRARARGLDCRVVEAPLERPLPRSGDIYLVGGGEDAAMLLAWEHLVAGTRLEDAVAAGAACFGVCAGFQLLGMEFAGPDQVLRNGLGLLDVRCGRLDGPRAVGEVLAERGEGDDFLTGFENHQGDARLGPAARPLARLLRGVGNGDGRTEGAVQGRVVGSYLHGPALVRNDGLADHLLELVTGPLAPFDDLPVRRLRQERRAAALSEPRPRPRGRAAAVSPVTEPSSHRPS
jgi:CobQ-like glutamine amidotransferase family enzyme